MVKQLVNDLLDMVQLLESESLQNHELIDICQGLKTEGYYEEALRVIENVDPSFSQYENELKWLASSAARYGYFDVAKLAMDKIESESDQLYLLKNLVKYQVQSNVDVALETIHDIDDVFEKVSIINENFSNYSVDYLYLFMNSVFTFIFYPVLWGIFSLILNLTKS